MEKWYFFEKKETHTKFNILYSRLHLIYFQNWRAEGNQRSTHISNWPSDKQYKQQIQLFNSNLRLTSGASLPSDIVLGGFKHKIGVNLRDLALVILKIIHPDLESRDIISAHPLRRNNRRKESLTPSTSSTASTDTTTETQTSEPTSSFSSQQLIVSLSSPALVHAIIHSTIKLKKAHTSTIDNALLQSLDDPAPLASGLINVNEFLPIDVFKLHNQVRSKAKEKQNAFSTFVRGRKIYARPKTSDKPTCYRFAISLSLSLSLSLLSLSNNALIWIRLSWNKVNCLCGNNSLAAAYKRNGCCVGRVYGIYRYDRGRFWVLRKSIQSIKERLRGEQEPKFVRARLATEEIV